MTKLALITGGSRGIGKSVVDLLRGQGWDVIAPTRRELDFSFSNDARCVSQSADIINANPPFDAVVFCHGEWYSKRLQMTYTDFLNLYISRVVYPTEIMRNIILDNFIKKKTCCFVSVSSTRGLIGGVETSPYAAACAAQISIIQGYARERKNDSMRYNCVCPGLTDTDMGQQVIATGGAKPDAAMQPREAVARVIVDLVQDGVSNGRVVRVVDGKASDARWVWE